MREGMRKLERHTKTFIREFTQEVQWFHQRDPIVNKETFLALFKRLRLAGHVFALLDMDGTGTAEFCNPGRLVLEV